MDIDNKGKEERRETKFRKNTTEEIKAMRNSRRRRMRQRKVDTKLRRIKQLKQKLETTKTEVNKGKKRIETLRCMSRTFWERWKWELEKRKEVLLMNRRAYSHVLSSGEDKLCINEIDPKFLSHPTINGEQKECFLGRGSLGIVRLMMYQSLRVEVKQMHVKSFVEDLQKEAEVMASLSHPFLPFLFGTCTKTQPLKIVMQFHGFFGGFHLSVTVRRELDQHHLHLTIVDWISVCAQILEAVNYLHGDAKILHNDITTTNIILGPSTIRSNQCTSTDISIAGNYQIVLIDFGKAIKCEKGKMFYLTNQERLEYQKKIPQIAPEVREGECRQSIYSDIFAVGGVLYQIVETGCTSFNMHQRCLLNIAEKCHSVCYLNRISANEALSYLQDNIILSS